MQEDLTNEVQSGREETGSTSQPLDPRHPVPERVAAGTAPGGYAADLEPDRPKTKIPAETNVMPAAAEAEVPPDATTPIPRGGPLKSWYMRQRDDLVRDALIAFVVLIFALSWDSILEQRQEQFAHDLAHSSEVLENVRFVRQVVIDDSFSKPFADLNLQGAALAGLDLSCEYSIGPAQPGESEQERGCADLAGANLSDASLSGANLSGASFYQANLAGANLKGAEMIGADLFDSHLSDAILTEANLTSADLSVARLFNAILYSVNLTDADLFGALMDGAIMSGAKLTNSNLSEADLTEVDLTNANLNGANLTDANLTDAMLYNANLTDANLTDANLTNTCYDDATIWPIEFTPPEPPRCQ